MIRFILKGILRDKNRSVLPVIVISIGVALTILLSGYIRGVMGDMIETTAIYDTGHVKIMSHAYAEQSQQMPNDLALLGLDEIQSQLKSKYDNMEFVPRIRFGGLIDIPDENGQSTGQGPVAGLGLDLDDPLELKRYNIEQALVLGANPKEPFEVLVSQAFYEKAELEIGDEITYFGTTMEGSMSFQNFKISGTLNFGNPMLDQGALVVNLPDAQSLLDMQDGASEIVGYFKQSSYKDAQAVAIADEFNASYNYEEDPYAAEMFALRSQNDMATLIDIVDYFSFIFVSIFVFAMSIVLWNTGLLGGLRRYQEFGIRLALGESKLGIYRSLFFEAVLIGIIGSVIGTLLGLAGVMYMEKVGIDISSMMESITILMPTTLRAKYTPNLLYIGFIPGVFAMVMGNLLSGYAIYRRETANLFKDLEV
jgi:putative ABC transport system permease protein